MLNWTNPSGDGPGESWLPFSMIARNRLRASDSDREQTAAQLAEHHVAGRLTADELRERVDRAYGARTLGELRSLVADLPGNLPQPGLWPLARAGRHHYELAPGFTYGGFWARAGGLWFDLLVVGIADGFLNPVTAAVHLSGLLVLFAPAYFVLFWGAVGRTPGMALLRLRVVRQEDGGRLGFGRSLVRLGGYLLDLCSFGLGLLWAAVDSRKQAWHDKLAGSVVVRRLP